jgi:hypothetical protein
MYRASIRKHWHEFCTMRRGAQESLELESQEAMLLGWFLSCVWIWVGFKFPLCSISVCLLQMESFSVFHQDRCRCIKKWNQMLNSEGTTIILACYQVCKHEVGLAAKLNIATFLACYWHHLMRACVHQPVVLHLLQYSHCAVILFFKSGCSFFLYQNKYNHSLLKIRISGHDIVPCTSPLGISSFQY